MATLASPAATMKLVGGDPGLDFVNTVGGRGRAQGSGPWPVRADKLASYSDLVAFGVHAGLLGEGKSRLLRRAGRARPREAGAALGRALAFREALYRALRGRSSACPRRPPTWPSSTPRSQPLAVARCWRRKGGPPLGVAG